MTRTWVTAAPFTGWLVVHANGANLEARVEPQTSLRFDGAFRVVGGGAKVSVWAFHVLDGPHRGACLLLESHWTSGLWPFLSMWGGVVMPTGDDEVALRRRQAAIIIRDDA